MEVFLPPLSLSSKFFFFFLPASIPHASLNHKPQRQRLSVGVNVRQKDCPGVNAMPHAASELWERVSLLFQKTWSI